ncbi:MAG TPA: hypothetical protein VK509_03265 [Polyangiales bacterium]|nr:hypothetical protein [Polyangiales bacterium]
MNQNTRLRLIATVCGATPALAAIAIQAVVVRFIPSTGSVWTVLFAEEIAGFSALCVDVSQVTAVAVSTTAGSCTPSARGGNALLHVALIADEKEPSWNCSINRARSSRPRTRPRRSRSSARR